MDRFELLTVEDTFLINLGGVSKLIIRPNLTVPKTGWKHCSEKIVIVKPDGHEIEAAAEIELSHFNIRDPKVTIEERWKVTVMLTDRTKEEVPIGSKIMVPQKIGQALKFADSTLSGL